MRTLSTLIFIFSGLAAWPAVAAEPGIAFISPANDARLDAKSRIKISYELTPGRGSDHAHLYVDGKEEALLRRGKGEYTLDPLAPGSHELCAKMVDRNHTPIGIERCIKITTQ